MKDSELPSDEAFKKKRSPPSSEITSKRALPDNKTQVLLVVDRSGETEKQLRESWRQLHLENSLIVVKSRAEAQCMLQETVGKRHLTQVAAIILDPDTTEEETGIFMREARLICKRRNIPIFLWTRNNKTYKALESNGNSKVVHKSGILQLIHKLHEAGLLTISPFHPHSGGPRAFSLCL